MRATLVTHALWAAEGNPQPQPALAYAPWLLLHSVDRQNTHKLLLLPLYISLWANGSTVCGANDYAPVCTHSAWALSLSLLLCSAIQKAAMFSDVTSLDPGP